MTKLKLVETKFMKSKKSKKSKRMLDLPPEILAMVEGPTQRKTWSIHDMRTIRPKTENQKVAIRIFGEGHNLTMLGSAGTGKTLIACMLAAQEMLNGEVDKMVFIRSAVPSRDVGFLPGTLDEKLAIYEETLEDTFAYLFKRRATYKDMKAANKIQFASTSYLRGVTFDNAAIILDEVQNLRFDEIETVITRMGENSRLIIMGDTRQSDLNGGRNGVSGVQRFMEVASKVDGIDHVIFTPEDCVRSGFVRDWLIASEKYGY